MSPDGQTIVTGAGDETLRFWNVFPSVKSPVSFPKPPLLGEITFSSSLLFTEVMNTFSFFS